MTKVFCSKIWRQKLEDIADDNKVRIAIPFPSLYRTEYVQRLEAMAADILAIEEVLLEALCFDFVVASPHAELIDLLDAHQEKPEVEEHAWTIASDS